VPWKLAETDPETAYIGISYAVRPPDSDRPRFVTCCSQVFDADGAGLEFVAYDAHDVECSATTVSVTNEMFRSHDPFVGPVSAGGTRAVAKTRHRSQVHRIQKPTRSLAAWKHFICVKPLILCKSLRASIGERPNRP